jgi:hypothetical protein
VQRFTVLGALTAIALAASGTTAPAASAAPPESYAAVAFSPSLKALREGFGTTAEDAQIVALNACLQYAQTQSEYYNDCAPFAWVRNGWVGFASHGVAPRELDAAFGGGWGHTSSEAAGDAEQTCLDWDATPAPECIQVGGSPFRSQVHDETSETTGGVPTITWTTAPLPPVALEVKALNSSTIRLTWQIRNSDVFTGRSGFEISNGDQSRFAQPDETSWDWAYLAPGTYMCFKVRAINGVGNSWWEPNADPWYRCATTPGDGG